MNRALGYRGVRGEQQELQQGAAFIAKHPQVHKIDGWPAKPKALRERGCLWVIMLILDIVSALLALLFIGKLRIRNPFIFNAVTLLTMKCSSRLYNDRVRWATDIWMG